MCDHEIDITTDVCPFTFVKTKLLLERMTVGETVRVRLKGAAPLKNVPRSAREHGHHVLSLTPEAGEPPEGVHRLILRKGG
ncbi:sulfurtransferase TusA family protein [Roseospira visakhapatnamensis]|uniref:TusA-related sulfurtransferase n=1 Tax=Roseospira visakhapatnamensis TaxID=390880 RepID=A0A7W6RCD7_9PROT|nr:sulfurtransferase TusA family protein [Roseospira visakhapatnamensis]MBB4265561.1 TusA-related sulfurtransferase [Roseospira visakhapatnamensis]